MKLGHLTRRLLDTTLLLACIASTASAAAPRPRVLKTPAPANSAEPDLFAGAHGVYLSWMTAHGDQKALQFAVLAHDRWSAPRTVVSGSDLLANWADFPSVVELADGSLAAHWLRENSGGDEAYDLLVARSRDGVTWPAGIMPYGDRSAVEHGFVQIVPGPAGNCTVVWLDGREYAGKEEGAPGVQTQLRSADLGAQGFGPEVVLDERVCDCCQTAAVRTARGLLVAYRDRSADEIRDMALVRRDGDRWTPPYPLSHDGWKIPGCPVNGPALASDGDRVAAAWFTMQDQQPVVQVALSSDGGITFSKPVRVDEGSALGRVDIAVLPAGGALVVWIESSKTGDATIRARRLGAGGQPDPAFTVGGTTAKRSSGFPHVVRAGDRLYFAWTGGSDPPRVQMAQLELRDGL